MDLGYMYFESMTDILRCWHIKMTPALREFVEDKIKRQRNQETGDAWALHKARDSSVTCGLILDTVRHHYPELETSPQRHFISAWEIPNSIIELDSGASEEYAIEILSGHNFLKIISSWSPWLDQKLHTNVSILCISEREYMKFQGYKQDFVRLTTWEG